MKQISSVLFFLLVLTIHFDAIAQTRAPIGRSSGGVIHNAGAKIFENNLYELYEYNTYRGWCEGNEASLIVVFKVNDSYVITYDETYKQHFEKEIQPIIRQRCNVATRIILYNYIKGVRINGFDLKEYADNDQTYSGKEVPLNRIVVEILPQGGIRYLNSTRQVTSLVGLRKERDRKADEREPSHRLLPAGATSLGNSGYLTLYSVSADPRSWCGPTVEMIITTRDSAGFEKEPDSLRYLLKDAWGKSRFHCEGQTKRINMRMLADGKEVRRGWLKTGNNIGRVYEFYEEFSESQSPNPAKEKLSTSGLAYQPIIDNIFYGRFDRMRAEDPGKPLFVLVYAYFLRKYGERHETFLQPPAITLIHTQEWTRRGFVIDSRQTEWKIEKRFEPHLRNYLTNYIMGGMGIDQIIDDMVSIVSQHKGNSPAIRQFLDNLLRYADDQPSIQEKPPTLSTTQGNKTSISPIAQPPTEPLSNNPIPRMIGRWVGKVRNDASSGDRDCTIIFRREDGVFIGRIPSGMGPRLSLIRDIKLVNNNVMAIAGSSDMPVNIKFNLAGETMKGQGTFESNGKTVTIYFDLRRVSTITDEN